MAKGLTASQKLWRLGVFGGMALLGLGIVAVPVGLKLAKGVVPGAQASGPPPKQIVPRPAPPPVITELIWNARVTKATGSAPRKKTACAVDATISDGSLTRVAVHCGKRTLYDSSQPLNGMSSHSARVDEKRTGAASGMHTYTLLWTDTGPRSGRAQASIDTSHQQARVFSETGELYSADLDIDELSAPHAGSLGGEDDSP